MATNTSFISQARGEAEIAAARELIRLNINQNQPVNVFQVIEQAGLWLFFQPLQDLQGVYLKDPNNGSRAIVINSRRPLSMQRLTAAHEYGHNVLGHEASLDDATDVELSNTHIAQEAAAQAFASDFLMPPTLVNTLWKSLNLPLQQKNLEPPQVYLLSLYLGVSYKALIYQLIALRRIGWPTARRLITYQPRQIKQLIGRGIGPLDSFADVWPLAQEDKGRHLHTRVNDEISIALPETPSSGYRWSVVSPEIFDVSQKIAAGIDKVTAKALLAGESTPDVYLALLGDDFEGASSQHELIGAGGHRYLNFRIVKPGSFAITLHLVRPWQVEATPADTFEVTIHSARQATGDLGNGPREEIKKDLRNSLPSRLAE